jgi:hypothetical protein
MAIVTDYLDRLKSLQSDRQPWEDMWFDVARYTLPDAERFDTMFSGRDRGTAIDTVVGEPVGAKRSRDVYDMTSLWAVDRGANGFLSLVTPQAETWHDIETDDPFGGEADDEGKRFYDRTRDYLFASRANPRSGFWMAHKASIRSIWAFGMGVVFVQESGKGANVPISYRHVPLSENYLGCNFEGVVDTDYRLFTRSAAQCVQKWGNKVSAKVQQWAESQKGKDKVVHLLHAVQPREDKGRQGNDNRNSPFSSVYIEVETKHLIGESGFFEFPYRVDHWQRNNPGPYAEGPVSLALAEIKSLNMLSKQELLATQAWVRPPLATLDDGMVRLNLNPGAVNPGALMANGQLGAQPITNIQRPDFAQTILEQRRNAIRETLYVNLWQTLVQERPGETATAAMIRSQEKADLLGPAGSSLQVGLSFQVEREIAILERMGAFKPDSPLAAPKSVAGRNIGVRFASPLDRMRRLSQLQGMQQLAGLVGQVAQVAPEAAETIDWVGMIDEAQDILGVPRKIMTSDDQRQASAQQRNQMMAAQMAGPAAEQAGNAATAIAGGAQAVQDSPAASDLIRQLAGAAA